MTIKSAQSALVDTSTAEAPAAVNSSSTIRPINSNAISAATVAKNPPRELAIRVIELALDQKARDVRGLYLNGVSDIADYFVIGSGTSDRHLKGIADNIKLGLKSIGELPISITGYDNGEWVLMDYGDVVVHLFHEPVRRYYDFDGLWHGALPVEFPPDLENLAKQLRTGMFNS